MRCFYYDGNCIYGDHSLIKTMYVRPVNCNDFISTVIQSEQRTQQSFRNSESVKPLCRKMIHCFEALQSKLFTVSKCSSRNDSMFRSAPIGSRITNHLVQIETSKRVSQIISFRSDIFNCKEPLKMVYNSE